MVSMAGSRWEAEAKARQQLQVNSLASGCVIDGTGLPGVWLEAVGHHPASVVPEHGCAFVLRVMVYTVID